MQLKACVSSSKKASRLSILAIFVAIPSSTFVIGLFPFGEPGTELLSTVRSIAALSMMCAIKWQSSVSEQTFLGVNGDQFL